MADIASRATEILEKVRATKPLIHHITNFVVMNETANITLCTGALPVMAHAKQEVEEMASAAHALVLNLGTLWPEQVEAMLLAGRCANERGIPVILDPVGAGATRFRSETAQCLLKELSISVARGNLAEMAVLAGYRADIRGVESAGVLANPADVAVAFAGKYGCVAAITGPIDIVTDGGRVARIHNGHPMMRSVTGTGCMSTAVVAAYVAVDQDHVIGAAAALAAFGLAGEIASRNMAGPGSFHVGLYDALAALTPEAFAAGMRIEVTG